VSVGVGCRYRHGVALPSVLRAALTLLHATMCRLSLGIYDQVFSTQELALVDLYWSTNGPNWVADAATNWVVDMMPASASACDPSLPWANIDCDGDGNVV
jgi:hypothetical protein